MTRKRVDWIVLAKRNSRTASLVLGLFALQGSTPPSAHAHITSDIEINILRNVPEGLVGQIVEQPDSLGYAGANRGGAWIGIEHQADALLLLIDACVRADSLAAEGAWRAIDAAFIKQLPSGDYEGGTVTRAEQLTRATWWIAELCRAEVVVLNSPLQDRFRWRVALMLPKLRRSVNWLTAAGEELLVLHASRPDLLLVDAQAFLLADGIYHEPRMAELGQRALVTALEGQRKDGSFVANASAIGAQGRALVALLEITTYFPMPSLDGATQRGMQWLARSLPKRPSRKRTSTNMSRSLKRPASDSDIVLALAFQASRSRDGHLRQLAENLATTWTDP